MLNLVRIGLPLALLVYLLASVQREDYVDFWNRPKRWELLAAAQAVALVAIVISFLRWQLLVRCFEIPFTTREALRLGFLGYLMNFVSLGSVGGDFFKAILVAREKRSKRPEAVASVLLDRAVGLLGLILLAWFCIQFLATDQVPPLIVRLGQAAGVLSLLSVVSLLLLVYAGNWLNRLIKWLSRNIPWIGMPVARMAVAVRLLRKYPTSIPILIVSSVLVHAMLTASVYLVSRGLYPKSPTLQQHIMVIPPAMAAGALPIAPGGLGVQEGAIVGLFQVLPDIDAEYSSVLVAAVFRLITLAIAGAGVAYYIASHGKEWQYFQQATAGEKPDGF
jgi:uncharacterized protein (TIRG00374 family)